MVSIVSRVTLYAILIAGLTCKADNEAIQSHDLNQWLFFINTPSTLLSRSCSGVAISSYHVLTTDYCVFEDPTLNTIGNRANTWDISVESVTFISSNKLSTHSHRLALLKTVSPVLSHQWPVISSLFEESASSGNRWTSGYVEKTHQSPPLKPFYEMALRYYTAIRREACQTTYMDTDISLLCGVPENIGINNRLIHGAPLFNSNGELVAIGYKKQLLIDHTIPITTEFNQFIPIAHFYDSLRDPQFEE